MQHPMSVTFSGAVQRSQAYVNMALGLNHAMNSVQAKRLGVSVDWFLNRIATHILAFEGDSHVEWFHGNYEDYEADRKRRHGEDAMRPKRIKFRRLAN